MSAKQTLVFIHEAINDLSARGLIEKFETPLFVVHLLSVSIFRVLTKCQTHHSTYMYLETVHKI